MFLELATNTVKTERQIRAENPNTSFPKPMKVEHLEGYAVVLPAPKPAPSSDLKVVVKSSPVQDANGNWVEGYTEKDMFSDTEEATKAEQEAAYLADLAEKEKQAANDLAIQDFIAETDLLKTGYTQEEIDSFPVQEAEAAAFLADPAAPTPLLDAILAVTGENKADLATHIAGKAAALKAGLGAALGRKRKKINDLGI